MTESEVVRVVEGQLEGLLGDVVLTAELVSLVLFGRKTLVSTLAQAVARLVFHFCIFILRC